MHFLAQLVVCFVLALFSQPSLAQPELTRPLAARLLSAAPAVEPYRTRLYLVPNAKQIGIELGWWRMQGMSTIPSHFSPEVQAEARSYEIGAAGFGASFLTLTRPLQIQINITGITGDRRSPVREVEFTWRYADPPRLLRHVALEGGSGTAVFRHFDDGWRFAEVLVGTLSDRRYPVSDAERDAFAQSVVAARQRNQSADITRRARLKESMSDFRVLREFRATVREQYRQRETTRTQVARLLGSHLVATDQGGIGFSYFWLGWIEGIEFDRSFKMMRAKGPCTRGHSGLFQLPEEMHSQLVQALNEARAAWRAKYSDVVNSFGNLCDSGAQVMLNDPSLNSMVLGLVTSKDSPLWFDANRPAVIEQSPEEVAPELTAEDAKTLIQKVLDRGVDIPLGRFTVVQEGQNWSAGRIHADAYAWAQAAAKVDLVTVQAEPGSQPLVVTILMKSDPSRISTPQRTQSYVLRIGRYSALEITGNEPRIVGRDTYRLIQYSYAAEWEPIARHFAEITGKQRESQRKAAILYKWNPSRKEWQATRAAVANASEPLDIAPLTQAMAR